MISIIIPTYNERENIRKLVPALTGVMQKAGLDDYEILVMDDDSPDGTARAVKELGNPRARAVNRRGRPRGLARAVADGFSEARGNVLGVMDADLSHPPEAIPRLVAALGPDCDLAVASRYVPGGGVANWPWHRRLGSRAACLLARPLTRVRDATSGFFFIKKEALEGVALNPTGFKIGLEVAVKARHGGRVKEVPYVFTDRTVGQSKLGGGVMAAYLRQLCSLCRPR